MNSLWMSSIIRKRPKSRKRSGIDTCLGSSKIRAQRNSDLGEKRLRGNPSEFDLCTLDELDMCM